MLPSTLNNSAITMGTSTGDFESVVTNGPWIFWVLLEAYSSSVAMNNIHCLALLPSLLRVRYVSWNDVCF